MYALTFGLALRKGYPEYDPDQPRGAGGKWTSAGGGSDPRSSDALRQRYKELQERIKPGLTPKEVRELKRDIKAFTQDLSAAAKEVRELGRGIDAKPKPWWQIGDKQSDNPKERIGGVLGRLGYTDAQATKWLYNALVNDKERWATPKPARGERFLDWVNRAVRAVPSSVVMSVALDAPAKVAIESDTRARRRRST